MINTTELVKAFINSHHGWAVADQFEDTFDPSGYTDFSAQNMNALRYIKDTVHSLINSDVLSEDSIEELQAYYDQLTEYLHTEAGF